MKKICLKCNGLKEHWGHGLCLLCYSREYQKKNKERIKIYRRQYYIKNKEKLNKQATEYARKHKKYINKRNYDWRQRNPERAKQCQARYREKHRDKIRSQRKKFMSIPKNRVNHSINTLMLRSLKIKKNGSPWESLAGYTIIDLMQHLESLFLKGMTFRNHGKWHIDHIKPVSSFNFESYEDGEFKQCWALENLQPLWAVDNLRKNKYIISEKANK